MSELALCTDIEQAVWGEGVVPTHMLRAITSMGGLAVGAFDGAQLVGFAFGFMGRKDGRLLHHSHVLAVLPAWRGRGIGAAIKREQARLCLEQGLDTMTWTFDPLRARNAHLNLERLGVTVSTYEPEYYGVMTDAQNGQLASDRLLAEWDLTGPQPRWRGDAAGLPRALVAVGDAPGVPDLSLGAEVLHVAVPADLDRLLASAAELAAEWRLAVRTVLVHYLGNGWRATGFSAGGYILQAGPRDL